MIIKPHEGRGAALAALEALRREPGLDVRRRAGIEGEVRKLRAGEAGERAVAYELDFHFGPHPNYLVLHGLRLEVGGRVAQIDHLLVSIFLDSWIIESKTRQGGLRINELGEFTTLGADGRRVAIDSPVEQVRRQRTVFRDALRRKIIRAPRLLGIVPLLVPCQTVIAVAGDAVIERPEGRVPGVERIVRADMVGSLVRRDNLPRGTSLMSHLNLGSTFMTRARLHAFGQSILAAHRPVATDWHARFRLPAADGQVRCEVCGRGLTPGIVAYCKSQPERFGGRLLCREHQRLHGSEG